MLDHTYKYIYSYFIVFGYFIFNVSAQTAPVKFAHISSAEGLPQSPVFCMHQDNTGFVWIGTSNGLLRYDGYEFKTYQHDDDDENSISNNRIHTIYEDHRGGIWVGTVNGLNLFDSATEKFIRIKSPDNNNVRLYISSLFTDKNENLWVSTLSGLRRLNRKLLRLEKGNICKDLSRVKSWITFPENTHSVWVGLNKGVAHYDPLTNQCFSLPAAIKNNKQFNSAAVFVIRADRHGNLWFGTENSGIFRYDKRSGTFTNFLHSAHDPNSLLSNGIKDIYINNDNKIWIATREGLSILDTGTNLFSNYKHDSSDPGSLSYDLLWQFMKDRAGNIWIGTFAGGINIYSPANTNFNNIGERLGSGFGLSNVVANTVIEDRNGGLWVGTNGGGLNYIHPGERRSVYYYISPGENNNTNNIVRSLTTDNAGNVWAGTYNGLYVFIKKTNSFKDINIGGPDNRVISLLFDSTGIWAGTLTGGLKYIHIDGKVIKDFRHSATDPASLSDDHITALIGDAYGNIIIGTENGLNYFDRKLQKFTRYYHFEHASGLSNNTIISLFRDSKQHIWIGTEGGLNYFDSQSRQIHRMPKGVLPDAVIHAIVEDNAGNLWVNTNKGVSRLFFKKFSLPFKKSDIDLISYQSTGGLLSAQFLTGAAIKTAAGEIVFGGTNGLTIFYPNKIIRNTFKPPVVFTDFMVHNKPVNNYSDTSALQKAINHTREINLKYNQNNLTLKYAALSYLNAASNQYAYKLEGGPNNDNWTYVGHQRTASFTNLEPGNYTFSVKAANNDGIWNERPLSIRIIISPPLWKTWWAYLAYFITASVILYYIIRFFRLRIQLRRDLYHEQLQNERQQTMYQMKLDFFTNISHEIRTPLTLILTPLEKMIGQAAENISLQRQLIQIKKNADRLMRLITELMDFRKAETGNMKLQMHVNDLVSFLYEIYLSFQNLAISKRIDYSFDTEAEKAEIFFDKDQLEKVFFNILSNAFKFTPDGGRIRVALTLADEAIEVLVEDNGKGIPEESGDKLFTNFYQADPGSRNIGSGIGLALTKSIVELHGGKISFNSLPATEKTEGNTVFTVYLKCGTSHFSDSQLISIYTPANNNDNDDLYHCQQQIEIPPIPENTTEAERVYTIQLIEDNEEIRQFIKESLITKYYIIESSNGIEGMECAFNHIPDLVISDVMMPQMDGFELCRRLKTDERTNHIPVILLTARTAYIHQVNGFETGADVYMTKPFSIQLLELNIHNLLTARDIMRKKFSQEVILQPRNTLINNNDEKFLSKIIGIIEDGMENPEFGVAALSSKIGMSQPVLYRKLKALTDLSVADFIKSIRMKQAVRLLRQKQFNISEIAFKVGFNNRKYFSKEFRKQFNMSPTEFAENPEIENPVNRVNEL